MAFVIGFLLVAILGVAHHFALRGLDLLAGSGRRHGDLSLVVIFIGLLFIHTLEILSFAGAYRLLLSWGWMGEITGEASESWSSLIYFSGINFTTLGYTQLETTGSIRMVSMMQALGGFMVLTWSATFIYSAWNRVFKN